jgi:hypothetical protein
LALGAIITIQAVANAFTCIIDITESAIGFEETTLERRGDHVRGDHVLCNSTPD